MSAPSIQDASWLSYSCRTTHVALRGVGGGGGGGGGKGGGGEEGGGGGGGGGGSFTFLKMGPGSQKCGSREPRESPPTMGMVNIL